MKLLLWIAAGLACFVRIAATSPLVLAVAETAAAEPAVAELAVAGPGVRRQDPVVGQALLAAEVLTLPQGVAADSIYWIRCWVRVHDNFFTPHERNLFEESVGIHIRGFVGAHELWVNGQKIGTTGHFPPAYQPAPAELIRHKIPAGTLRPNHWNEVAFRVYQPGPQDGFQTAVPFIMNYFYECEFAGPWELWRTDSFQPGPALAEQPATATFQDFRDSQQVLGRTEQIPGPRLPPSEAAAAIDVRGDLGLELLLHEPTIAQPFHFSFDQRGRLWVTQCRQYPYPAGLRMLSRDRYYRSHYDRVPLAPPHHDPGADLVSIHEDTTGDGRFDHHKVFVAGLNLANAAVKGVGGVWIMHTPYLLFYPDADDDDIPDGPPEVHLSGFGFEDTHAMANGLVWGPDGWLYGCQGSSTSCRVLRPGVDPPDASGVYFEGCMVWRYHPQTRAFEIFAEGGGNTFGLEFDSAGRLYSGHNGADTRGWHFVQGGFYLMQHADPSKFGPPRNPYAFGDLPMMATSTPVVRFSHFGAFAEGATMPSHLQGQLLALDPIHNEVIAVRRSARGSTFQTADEGVVAKSRDEAFRPVFIANAPDGSLMLADMYEYYIAHGQHYQNQIDPSTGRIYRLVGTGLSPLTDVSAAAKSTRELETWLEHPNKWQRFAASRELGLRQDPDAAVRLNRDFSQFSAAKALHALWALQQMERVELDTWQMALEHPSPPVRMWAVRGLGDRHGVQRNLGLPPTTPLGPPAGLLPDALREALIRGAANEPDAEVRCQIAATARRLELNDGLHLLRELLQHDSDATDPYLPLMAWWVLEAHLPAAADEAVNFVAQVELWKRPILRDHILPRLTRRLAVDGRRADLLRVAELLRLGQIAHDTSPVMRGLEEAFQGRALTALPAELLAVLNDVGGGSLLFRMRQGHSEAFDEALAILANPQSPLAERLNLTRGLAELFYPDSVPTLLQLIESEQPGELKRAAFVALARYDQPDIADRTFQTLPTLSPESRTAAVAMLVSRPAWSQQLLERISSDQVPLAWLPANILDQLRSSDDPEIRHRVTQLTSAPAVAGELRRHQIADIETWLKEAAGNPYAGEKIYLDRCAACHRLFFKGGNLGPDLTSYQRDNLSTMVLSIVNPSLEIREGYELFRVLTVDGRLVQGFQVERDHQVLVLRGPDGQDLSLAIDEIEQLEPAGRSLMPDGLLDDLTAQQVRDLFAYLRISQPFTD